VSGSSGMLCGLDGGGVKGEGKGGAWGWMGREVEEGGFAFRMRKVFEGVH
jgi:hypothetical protein